MKKINDKKTALYVYDSNVVNVLKDDGLPDTNWKVLKKYQNITTISFKWENSV